MFSQFLSRLKVEFPLNLENLILFFLTLGLCFQRLSMAVGSIAWGGALALSLYSMYKDYKASTLKLEPEFKGYYVALGVCILGMLPCVLGYGFEKSIVKQLFEMWIYRVSPFFIVVMAIKNVAKLKLVIGIFLAFLCTDCVVAVWQVAFLHVARGWGFGGNTLNLASIIAIVFPMLLITLLENKCSPKEKHFLEIVSIFLVAGLVAGQSRAAWVTVVLSSLLIFAYYCSKKPKQIALLLVLVAVLGIGVSSSAGLQKRLMSLTSVESRENVPRLYLWRGAVNIAKDNPLIGCGLDKFNSVFNDAYHFRGGSRHPHAHNNYLNLWAEAGIFGLLGFLYMTMYVLCTNFKAWLSTRNPYYMMLWTAWLTYMIFGMFDYIIDHSAVTKIWWFLLGCLLLFVKEEKKNE